MKGCKIYEGGSFLPFCVSVVMASWTLKVDSGYCSMGLVM